MLCTHLQHTYMYVHTYIRTCVGCWPAVVGPVGDGLPGPSVDSWSFRDFS